MTLLDALRASAIWSQMPTTDAERTVLLIPETLDRMTPTQPPTVRAITAAEHRDGGVYAVIGRGASLAGVAQRFLDLFAPRPAWAVNATPATYEAIGRELFRIATSLTFGQRQDPTTDRLSRLWTTGALVPLPALAPGGGPQLVLDATGLDTAANVTELSVVGRRESMSLQGFDPFATPLAHDADPPRNDHVRAARQQVLEAFQADPAGQAAEWRAKLLWNPYAAALPLIHLLSSSAVDPADLTVQLVSGRSVNQLAVIGRTSGGTALFRVMLLRSIGGAAGIDAARNAIAAALGIDVGFDLRTRRLSAQPIEPPLPPAAKAKARRVDNLVFSTSYLGRIVEMTWGRYAKVWSGPFAAGSLHPADYFQPIGTWPPAPAGPTLGSLLGADGQTLTTAQLDDRLRAINAIFDIEGYADAVRATDMALLSVGMQQFSFHVDLEGTVLFRRLRHLSDVWFDVFIRSAGLDVGKSPAVNYEQLQYPSRYKLKAAPPIARPQASSADVGQLSESAWLISLGRDGMSLWCVPGTVGKLPSGQKALPPVDGGGGALHTDCHDEFGFIGTSADSRAEELLARWAVAARLVPEAVQAQIELSVHRFTRMLEEPMRAQWTRHFTGSLGAGLTTEDLFPSDAHAAALVDCFINTPAAAFPAARRAYERAVAGWQQARQVSEVPDADDADFRLRMLLAFLSERRFLVNAAKSVPVFARGRANDVAPGRIARLLDRLEEREATPGLGRRVLRWTEDFEW